MIIRGFLAGAALLLTACGGRSAPPAVPPPAEAADLVLVNGRVVTVDSSRPEAEAVAIRGDRIVRVGSDDDVTALIGPSTRVLDLAGRLAVPGFIEGHGHFAGVGEAKLNLDLTTARSWDDIVALVARAAERAEPGEWILGRGWHQEKWDRVPAGAVEGVPTHHTLSAVSPEHPVVLTHASGHAAFVNAKAMELAGIDRDYVSRPGGETVRDANGDPTGLLRENDDEPVMAALSRSRQTMTAAEREARFRRVVELAGRESLSKGVTTFHDAGAGFTTLASYRRLAEEGALPVRLYAMVRGATNEEMARRLPEARVVGAGNHFLTVRSIKRQVDGALGSHGAWLLEPYADMPSSTGLVLEPVADIERTAELALEHGYQVNTHAIGDRANREILDLYERVFARTPGSQADVRWRIEHAQHLHPADIPRFAELGVIASMQGVHATSDAPWVPRRLGDERAHNGAYRWQDLWRSGALVTNGTDAPVEDVDPIASFWATVSRRLPDGGVFDPDQRLTREQALRSYTINNAHAAFEEALKGSITPGKLADIVVLSRDIMRVPEAEIREARVVYTILGGEVAYRAEGEER
ncbi:MAG TPA: amidohydrolase [Longimicrobiales bacterium]|nr:amidohydrolase [Longimicrobiales bacterium]